MNERILKSGLRSGYAALIVSAFPAVYFFYFGFATSLFLLAAVLVLVERWTDMREALFQLRGRSDEAIHLTAEIATRFAEQEQKSSILQQREVKFRKAFEHAAIGMAIVSTAGDILKANSALEDIIGFSDEQLKATNFETLLPEYEAASYRRELSKLFYGAADSIHIEQRLLQSNGDISWVLWTASMIPATGEDGPQYIFQFQDINDRKRAERQIAFDALHDSLTGLPNRTLFLDRLQVAFRNAQRSTGVGFAVCSMDFDRFKLVNDSFGHSIGDKLLIEIAARLRSLVPNGDMIARLGGDEFAILIEEIDDLEAAVSTAESIRNELARPFDLGGHRVQSTVSIGLDTWSKQYEHPEMILRDADTALSHAKHAGRDRCEVFSNEMREASVRFLENETDLRGAVDRGEFRAFYQPIVDLKSAKLAGFEALIRWEHPQRGLISPGEFIQIAEETGLIFPIGEWMLRQTCRQLAVWQRTYLEAEDIWISVNVSAKQFMQSNVVAIVSRLLEETGIRPESIKIELTESAMAENLTHVASVMSQLKRIGVRLCIDDFGTGYSSLSNLHLLPLDNLKVDRSFVNHMDESSENREIIKTIVSLAGSLNLDVIAEGVETEGQLAQLRSLGCGYGQGFYFAPPLDGLAAEALIRFSRILSPLVEPKHIVVETNLIAEGVPIQLKHVN
jgi:diguanylate cyclase (GGDEF)-like protein/PAS domain S-box-containing protein